MNIKLMRTLLLGRSSIPFRCFSGKEIKIPFSTKEIKLPMMGTAPLNKKKAPLSKKQASKELILKEIPV